MIVASKKGTFLGMDLKYPAILRRQTVTSKTQGFPLLNASSMSIEDDGVPMVSNYSMINIFTEDHVFNFFI